MEKSLKIEHLDVYSLKEMDSYLTREVSFFHKLWRYALIIKTIRPALHKRRKVISQPNFNYQQSNLLNIPTYIVVVEFSLPKSPVSKR